VRRVCYSVAMSLDGFIAGPQGEYDWIVMDPDIDFGAPAWRLRPAGQALQGAYTGATFVLRVTRRPTTARPLVTTARGSFAAAGG